MEYLEAIALRVRSLNGKAVDALQLEEAIRTIQSTRTPTSRSRTKGNRPRKPRPEVAEVEPQQEASAGDLPPPPWTLLKDGVGAEDPEHYVWPHPED